MVHWSSVPALLPTATCHFTAAQDQVPPEAVRSRLIPVFRSISFDDCSIWIWRCTAACNLPICFCGTGEWTTSGRASATTKDTRAHTFVMLTKIETVIQQENIAMETVRWSQQRCLHSFCSSLLRPSCHFFLWLFSCPIPSSIAFFQSLSLSPSLVHSLPFGLFYSRYFYASPINEIKFGPCVSLSLWTKQKLFWYLTGNTATALRSRGRYRGRAAEKRRPTVTAQRLFRLICYGSRNFYENKFVKFVDSICLDDEEKWSAFYYLFTMSCHIKIECLNRSDLWSVTKVSVSTMTFFLLISSASPTNAY